MKDKIFIDTNILVYANDRSEKDKHEKARQIVFEGIANENVAVSTQVLSEFFVTVTRKIKVPLSAEIAKKEILLFKNFEIVDVDFYSVVQAINISDEQQFSYWDALIIAAAMKARCTFLYSEDLNPGQRVDTVVIKNPFLG